MGSLPSGKIVFSLAVSLALSGVLSPPFALATGILFGLLFIHPFEAESRRCSIVVLQCSVVALGFGMNFEQVVRTGRAGFVYTAVGIGLAMTVGLLLGKIFKVRSKAALLISAGTAICGGSAIAALAPITDPSEDELAMSMGTIFMLNSVALFLFPVIGMTMRLSPEQFGLWSALAIHDTSSVVGAAAKFGPAALAIATVVKLTRALWIVPVAMVTAVAAKSKARIRFPWFIVIFCVAALANSSLTQLAPAFAKVSQAGHLGLTLALFLIGTGISKRVIKQTGVKVMAQGLVLWIAVAITSLLAIRADWIR